MTLHSAACRTGMRLICAAMVLGSALAARHLAQTDGAQVEQVWHVTVGNRAPDCFQRDVFLVNGTFQPSLVVTQGQTLQVTIFNEIPVDFPSIAGGISIHWHGFSMRTYEWFDGTGRITQCPVLPGQNFTYRFQVNEQPGTYFWHDHSAVNRVNGLQGALIVLPRAAPLSSQQSDDQRILFVSDWFHGEANSLQFALSRPFYPGSQTPETGAGIYVGNPQANLINGKGFYGDCALLGDPVFIPGAPRPPPQEAFCNVTTLTVAPGRSAQQPWAAQSNPGCSHDIVNVTQGQTYRFRIVNAGSIAYQSVCFWEHNVTIIAADATPTDPVSFGSCLDINAGQRYDVLLTASNAVGNYWITVQPQSTGAPGGYAILHYTGAPPGLPLQPTPQPGNIQPLSLPQLDQIVTLAELVNPSIAGHDSNAVYAVIADAAPVGYNSLQVPQASSRTIIEHVTQPILNQTGQTKWALNNVANVETPVCEAEMSLVHANNGYLPATAALTGVTPGFLLPQTVNNSIDPVIFIDNGTGSVLELPTAGHHILELALGEVIDIVVINEHGNRFNGDLTQAEDSPQANNRTEEHPLHLHGHHFWLLATGNDTYDPSTVPARYNLVNPIFRDTHTLPEYGWAVIRFVADNPGLWFYHCHIQWHQQEGMGLVFAAATDQIGSPPADLPVCANDCNYDAAGYTPAFVAQRYGATGYDLPGPNAEFKPGGAGPFG